jgi:KUP system potassium uptake protein
MTDPRSRRSPSSARSASLVVASLGIVFGDLGTSPLYALQECFTGERGVAPTPADVLGVVSLIVWSLVSVVTVKYVALLMRVDNRGEGGIMALLSLVPERLQGRGPGRVGFAAVAAVAGAALLFGDGIITPAVSVLSAVEGLGVATRRFEPAILPLTLAILVGLFAVQRWGTGKLATYFGPVMLLWLLGAAGLGVRQLWANPASLAALSPLPGVGFFARHGLGGARVLGGVVLAVTGCEALYADMGHFGRGPIRRAWLLVCLPALVLCYLGQASLLLAHPEHAARPFYSMCPPGPWLYAFVGLATAATVIASQALISGVFSLTHQAIQLGYFPRLDVLHTSRETEGQIYVPQMNAFLAAACVALVLAFRTSAALASAFGLAVSGTMLLTSVVYYVVLRDGRGRPGWQAGALLVAFLLVDVPFVVANGLKFFEGGYVPFVVAAGFTTVMLVWRVGRGLLADHYAERSQSIETFLAALPSAVGRRVPGVCVVMASLSRGVPAPLATVVRRLGALHERVILLTVSTVRAPYVPDDERLELKAVGSGLYRVLLRRGYMDSTDVPREVGRALAALEIEGAPGDVVYLLGRDRVVPSSAGRLGVVLESVFAFLARNAASATDYFAIPPRQVLEVGSQVDLLRTPPGPGGATDPSRARRAAPAALRARTGRFARPARRRAPAGLALGAATGRRSGLG